MRLPTSSMLTLLPLWLASTVEAGKPPDENICTVKANGDQKDGVPNLNDVMIQWHGQWTFSDDLDYWRNNSYPIAFQNHHASFIITGKNITIDGYGTGGINGNGNAWYTAEASNTQPGRPMPIVFWNVSDVVVENFFVKQPPLWSLNVMNGTNMRFHDIYCNATALTAPLGKNWVQNTDGFDTMDTGIQLIPPKKLIPLK